MTTRSTRRKAASRTYVPESSDSDDAAQETAQPPPLAYVDVEAVTTDTHLKGYTGRYDRGIRGPGLISMWYGPHERIAQGLLDRWSGWTVLPPKEGEEGSTTPWGGNEKEAQLAERWRGLRGVRTSMLRLDEGRPYEQPRRGLRVLMGPWKGQAEYVLRPGEALALTQAWVPLGLDGVPSGWVLDAGGIVTGMDWCPGRRGVQKLALAVIPHADQEDYDYETEHRRPGFQVHGTVQIWGFKGEDGPGGSRPSARPARLLRTICLDYGRAKRVRWCPVSNTVSDGARHSFAVLCGDGQVHVVEDDDDEQGGGGSFYKCISPDASLSLDNEYGVEATAFAWAGVNRLVIGYSDGSLALWSVLPCCMLSRHPVHHSLVVDVATAYPSQPLLVASTPLGGSTKLVDLSRATYETTEVRTNAVSWQPNMLAYSNHLQGFFSVYPSANALNTMVGFMHQRFFPVVRRIFIGESYNSSLAVGRTHPYLLIGTSDGSLWCLNPQVVLFSSRREATDTLRIFQHEHRPEELLAKEAQASGRGVSRVVHGFAIEKSRNPKAELRSQQARKRKMAEEADADADDANEDDEAGGPVDPARGIVHEPLSRITVVEWNPNGRFGCWAAAAMASGLVRVIDLGLDNDHD